MRANRSRVVNCSAVRTCEAITGSIMEGYKVVEKRGILDNNLDKNHSVKNPWKWDWLDIIVEGFNLSDSIPGHAYCLY